ncbi:MAG: CvpA family protein [Lachnospiraceae bacterium]|nr:CvpA family protein [Lachnospiraceae bacterium]
MGKKEHKRITNKKLLVKMIIVLAVLIIGAVYYYVKLPALNIHSAGFWKFLLFLIFVGTVLQLISKLKRENITVSQAGISFTGDKKVFRSVKWGVIAFGAVLLAYIIGSILSSPIVNAGKYQRLMPVEEREFQTDIAEVDYTTIPLLDKDSATILGERKMGSMIDMVSQFEVSNEYTQINYNGRPVRVTPLRYASLIKWITNQSNGIPAYLLMDMTTQDTQIIKLEQPIRYSKSEHFNRNLYRHLRFHYPTYIFDDQIFFEIDEEGTPYWVCPVKKFNIGLFGGQTVGKVVLCNAVTGECTAYDVEDVPTWVDKVYSAERLVQLYNYYGTLKNGYFNSILSQRGCVQTTNGYNYLALDDDVWVYTGVTSVNGDQSNVGFVLMNQRTMETRFYTVEGAIEDSAMSSAEGQVQHLNYNATFPLLVNIASEPTYIMALKDAAGLVKMYAMVNVQKYQIVAIGDTVRECERNYRELLRTNGIEAESGDAQSMSVSGTIESYASVVIDGNTHFYLCLSGIDAIFDFDMTNEELLGIIRYKEGDEVTIRYEDEGSMRKTVTGFE